MIAQNSVPWFLSLPAKWQFWLAVIIVVAGTPNALEIAKAIRAQNYTDAVVVAIPANSVNVVAPPPAPNDPRDGSKDPFQKRTDGCWAGTGAKGGYQLLNFLAKYAGQTVSLVFQTQGHTILAQFSANDGPVTIALSRAGGNFSLGSYPSRLEFMNALRTTVGQGGKYAPLRAWAAIRSTFQMLGGTDSSVSEEEARAATGTQGC